MSGVGQRLDLLINANGDGSPGSAPVGSPMQWLGGKAKVYAWATRAVGVSIQISPDGGSTWITVSGGGAVPTSGSEFEFSEPALLVRATSSSSAADQNLNVTLIGYDEA